MNTRTEVRKGILGAMSRASNPNNTPEKMASVLGATAGIKRDKIVKFINGDDNALTDSDVMALDALR